MIEITARRARRDDLDELIRLYGLLESEMRGLHAMWPRADGLAGPLDESWLQEIANPASAVFVGCIDDVTVGFLLARLERVIDGTPIGTIHLIFTEEPAREVGVAEVMLGAALEGLRAGGCTRFDARVLPGHRLAKNFFEQSGFSARLILMHHDDERRRRT